jgi:hypothetical protein
LFPHLKIGDKKNMNRLDKAAKKIQPIVRIFLAKCLLRRLKQARLHRKAKTIQHWFLTWTRRHRVLKAVLKIQPVWREKIQNYFYRMDAAALIQSIWRVYCEVKKYQELKRRRRWAVHTMQSMALTRLYVRKSRAAFAKKRYTAENRLAGKALYDQTELYTHIEFLWNTAKKTKKVDSLTLELQRVFSTNALQGYMDVNRLLKFFKECPEFMDSRVTSKVIELQFAKVKSQSDKRIDYPRFVELLANLAAIKFLHADPGLLGNYTGTSYYMYCIIADVHTLFFYPVVPVLEPLIH